MAGLPKLPNAAKPEIKSEADKPVGWLVGAVATVALLLSAVGIGTGDVPRVLRDAPIPASIMFVLVIWGSIDAVRAGWLTNQEDKEHRLLRSSTRLLAGAALAALATGIFSALDRPDPSITANISTDQKGRMMLHFEVKDSSLTSSNRMTIKVKALAADNSATSTTPLYTAALGPDSSGAVDHRGEVQVPPAPANDVEVQAGVGSPNSCYGKGKPKASGPGCVRVHITRSVERPQLTIAWRNRRHSGAGLFIQLSAHDVAGRQLALRVVDANTFRRLLLASWPARANGTVVKAVTAVVPAKTRRLCVAASTTRARPNCTSPPGRGNASVLTVVPPP